MTVKNTKDKPARRTKTTGSKASPTSGPNDALCVTPKEGPSKRAAGNARMDWKRATGGGGMTTKKPKPAKPKGDPKTTIQLKQDPNRSPGKIVADALLEHDFRHGHAAASFAYRMLGPEADKPGIGDSADFIVKRAKAAAAGELDFASHSLASQALTLDAMFTEYARIAALNIGNTAATEIFARLAMKAQAQGRATLEALAKMHQPREQTVKHVHINEGGQAVVADHFHAGGKENAESVKQSDATGAAGERAALPSPNPERDGVPIPSRKREAAMSYARGDKSRSS